MPPAAARTAPTDTTRAPGEALAGRGEHPASRDLHLDGLFAVDFFKPAGIDLRRQPVEDQFSGLQAHNPRPIPAGQTEEMQSAQDGDAIFLVELFDVLQHRMGRRGISFTNLMTVVRRNAGEPAMPVRRNQTRRALSP